MSNRPSSNISVGWLDLSTHSGLDKKFYDGPEMDALHSNEITPVSHFTRMACQLKKSGSVTSANYELAKTADFAGDTWYEFTTPDITIKAANQDTHRIAFTPNFGHHVVRALEFRANEVPIVKIDAVTMDALSEANLPAGKYEGYSAMIGNVDKAVTFSAHLPPITVRKKLHELWFVSSAKPAPENALALCALKHNRMNFQIEFIENLDQVIRIQENTAADPANDPAVWVDMDPKDVNLATIVDVVGGPGGLQMPLPDMWSDYVVVSKEERASHQAQVKDVLIEQVQSLTGPKVAAGTHRQKFYFSYPMRYLWFGARNVTAAAKHNFSNYSTNSADASGGIDPCRKVTLWYDNTARAQNFDGSFYSQMEYLNHAQRVPTVPGHHLQPYGYNTAVTDNDGSSNYSKLSTDLELEINETSTDSDDAATAACSYTIEIRGVNLQMIRLQKGVLGFPSFEQ